MKCHHSNVCVCACVCVVVTKAQNLGLTNIPPIFDPWPNCISGFLVIPCSLTHGRGHLEFFPEKTTSFPLCMSKPLLGRAIQPHQWLMVFLLHAGLRVLDPTCHRQERISGVFGLASLPVHRDFHSWFLLWGPHPSWCATQCRKSLWGSQCHGSEGSKDMKSVVSSTPRPSETLKGEQSLRKQSQPQIFQITLLRTPCKFTLHVHDCF